MVKIVINIAYRSHNNNFHLKLFVFAFSEKLSQRFASGKTCRGRMLPWPLREKLQVVAITSKEAISLFISYDQTSRLQPCTHHPLFYQFPVCLPHQLGSGCFYYLSLTDWQTFTDYVDDIRGGKAFMHLCVSMNS